MQDRGGEGGSQRCFRVMQVGREANLEHPYILYKNDRASIPRV